MDYEKYKNEMECPKKPKKPFLQNFHTSEKAYEYAQELHTYEIELNEYQNRMKAYRQHSNDLHNLFKKDALDDVGLKDHPKAEKAWEMAYEKGRSEGNYSVYQELCELADLLI